MTMSESSCSQVQAITVRTKYDMRCNPVYHVDVQNKASGKHLPTTKRHVLFRFGFSNAEAVSAGRSGSGCRGEEHEVSLVWSLTSGKRVVRMDGTEVHYSVGKRFETKFETCWTIEGGHIMKLVAHATLPVFKNVPDFRQYDLFLDGFSIFEMPRIYELGMEKNDALCHSHNPSVENSTFSVSSSEMSSISMERGDEVDSGSTCHYTAGQNARDQHLFDYCINAEVRETVDEQSHTIWKQKSSIHETYNSEVC